MEASYLKKILEKIKSERNVDFSQYREALLSRRVMVRVRATKCDNFEGYFAHLSRHPAEMDELMDVLTINVTEFFRDPKVFDAIEKNVILELFANKDKSGSKMIRIWSCGCSSGEEAYSVLMLISEFLGPRIKDYDLKIFGTDIDSVSLSKAKEGVFETTQFAKLSSEKRKLIDKYFYKMGETGHYWIREEWPTYMDFSYGDATADSQPEDMDIILCRNMLIYFDRELQAKVLHRLAGSLNMDGFLILGNVESLWGEAKKGLVEYDRQARIYRKKK